MNLIQRGWLLFVLLVLVSTHGAAAQDHDAARSGSRPNILLVVTDNQSYPHASAYGAAGFDTPAFDRVAREGVLFTNAFSASPSCSPSRATMLTGRHIWQIEQAGTHASSFPEQYVVFPDLLEQAGYHVGFTGKGWGPGDWAASGRSRNPAGPVYEEHTLTPPNDGISPNDYTENFRAFLAARSPGQPFYFWFGALEPHRPYTYGAGHASGKKLYDIQVPPFLPDAPEVRHDMLDYALEVEWLDAHLGRMLDLLEESGELDNTIVIVLSDNGMQFPRGIANVYEYGIHVPLAIRWGAAVPGGRVVDDLVSLIDLTPTLLEAAGVEHPGPYPMAGRSILNILTSERQGVLDSTRQAVYAGRERHSSSRYLHLSYPQRAIRTQEFLYIRNLKPERWPAGAPQLYEEDGTLGPMHDGYHDIDRSPTLTYLVANREAPTVSPYFHLSVDLRPGEELYDIRKDPGCLQNLTDAPGYQETLRQLRKQLERYLTETGDPRVVGDGDVFESYDRRAGPMRRFPRPYWLDASEELTVPAWIQTERDR